MKITRAIVKFAPVMPKARVEVIVAFNPVSAPMMPPKIMRTQQTANPIRVAQKMEPIVNTLPKIPPTISMGIQIIEPNQASFCL